MNLDLFWRLYHDGYPLWKIQEMLDAEDYQNAA